MTWSTISIVYSVEYSFAVFAVVWVVFIAFVDLVDVWKVSRLHLDRFEIAGDLVEVVFVGILLFTQ